MGGNVPVTLLVSVVLGNIVKVVPSNNNSALHLGRNDNPLKNLASNRDRRSERTFAVDVVRLNGLLGRLEAKSNVLVVSDTGGSLLSEQFFGIEEDIVLLLERTLVLDIGHGIWIRLYLIN